MVWNGFRPLATPGIILGRYQNIAYFVGSDPAQPYPPYKRGVQHSVGLGSIVYADTKFLTATIRLFGDSGAQDKGMPFYTVIYGSEGRRKIVARRTLAQITPKNSTLTIATAVLVLVDFLLAATDTFRRYY